MHDTLISMRSTRQRRSESGLSNLIVASIGLPIVMLLAAATWDLSRFILMKRELLVALERGAEDASRSLHARFAPTPTPASNTLIDGEPPAAENFCFLVSGSGVNINNIRTSCPLANGATNEGIISTTIAGRIVDTACFIATAALSHSKTAAPFRLNSSLGPSAFGIEYQLLAMETDRSKNSGSGIFHSLKATSRHTCDGFGGRPSFYLSARSPYAPFTSVDAFLTDAAVAGRFAADGGGHPLHASDPSFAWTDRLFLIGYGEARIKTIFGNLIVADPVIRAYYVYPIPTSIGFQWSAQ